MLDEMRWFGIRLDSSFKEIKLVVLSDIHYGNPHASVKHFERASKFIRENDNAFCILTGDLIECVTKASKGEIYRQVGSPQEQRDFLIEELLAPIKHKILAMCQGNHEARVANEVGIDITQDIAKAFNVPYRPEGVLLKISFGTQKQSQGRPYVFWSYNTHGYGGARTKSSKAVKVERLASWIYADLYSMSHDHVVNLAPNVFLMPDPREHKEENGFTTGKVTAHRAMLIKTNAFIKFGGYAEMGGFPPSDLATPVVYFLSPKSDMWNQLPDTPHQAVKVII